MNTPREKWGSKLGFILAASGSAVGIGNIWKYPHMAGQNGGAAFTLIYLICIFVVGLSIVIGEFAIGRKTQLSPVGAYLTVAPKSSWKWVGFLGVASAYVILSFYGVVGGWIMRYAFISLIGGFSPLQPGVEVSFPANTVIDAHESFAITKFESLNNDQKTFQFSRDMTSVNESILIQDKSNNLVSLDSLPIIVKNITYSKSEEGKILGYEKIEFYNSSDSSVNLSGNFLKSNADAAENEFDSFTANTWNPIFWQLLFMFICIYVIVNGVKGGIEKWSKIMMPTIIVILIVLAIRGLSLPNGLSALTFLFKPKFGDLSATAVVLALGHSFFTLSLGMGTMITYGSYLKKNENLLSSALWVIGLDTLIALIAGVAIFSTVFALGSDPAGGPGLIFEVLPSVFPEIPGGQIWGTLFFLILFMAALTSAISILEVVTAYFIDEKGWSRSRATIVFGGTITIVGIFCSLSFGENLNLTWFLDMSFFDFMDYLSSKYMLPIGGMLMAIFILKTWGVNEFLNEVHRGMDSKRISSQLVTILLSIGASVIAFIILNEVIEKLFGSPIIG